MTAGFPSLPSPSPGGTARRMLEPPVRRRSRRSRRGPALYDRRRRRTALRQWPTVALVTFCLVAGIPTTIALTPGRDVVAFGQVITVGARPVQLDPVGPARLVQVGNTAIDLRPLTVWGPLRPQLTMGPVQRNAGAAAVFDAERGPAARDAAVTAIVDGFLDWYLLAGAGLLAFTLVAALAAVGIRSLVVLRRA